MGRSGTSAWPLREAGVLSPMYVVLAACVVSAVCAMLAARLPDFLADTDAAGPVPTGEGFAATGRVRP